MKGLLFVAIASLALASCSVTSEQQAAAARNYDKICTAEPPLYAAFVNVATAKGSSTRTMRRAEAFHATITSMCASRPTDAVSALVFLAAAYVQIVQINASVR